MKREVTNALLQLAKVAPPLLWSTSVLPCEYIDTNTHLTHDPTLVQIPKGETALLLAEAPLICMLVRLLHHAVAKCAGNPSSAYLYASAVPTVNICTASAVFIAS